MSHFSVLVITAEKPTEDVLQRVLQPFHEFECTGIDDEYIQDIDMTEEWLKEYNEDTATRMVDQDGNVFSPGDSRFFRQPTEEERKIIGPVGGMGWGSGLHWRSERWDGEDSPYETRVRFLPEGYREVEMPLREVLSFAEWVKDWHGRDCIQEDETPDLSEQHKYGYCIVDQDGKPIKCIHRTNPNAKWDYWRVGGRYRSKLQVLTPTASTISSEPSWEWKPEYNNGEEAPEGFDSCQRRDLDLLHMKNEAVRQREQYARETLAKCELTADEYVTAYRLNEKYHKHWMTIEENAPRGASYRDAAVEWLVSQGHERHHAELVRDLGKCWDPPELGDCESLQEWIQQAPAMTTFAVLRDGKWYQRGEMGWWACVSNEDSEWDGKYNSLLEGIPDDHYLTVVDCHI